VAHEDPENEFWQDEGIQLSGRAWDLEDKQV
jgi:hypothetical protein